jgi:hypothetical protein
VVNGEGGKAPVTITATVGEPVTLDAAGTRDPDGDALNYRWFFYPEAGTGIPGQPVAIARGRPPGGGGVPGEGQIPSQPPGGPREPPARVTLTDETTPRVTVLPRVAGTAHVIVSVEDAGTPTLTSYRRVIITMREQ